MPYAGILSVEGLRVGVKDPSAHQYPYEHLVEGAVDDFEVEI